MDIKITKKDEVLEVETHLGKVYIFISHNEVMVNTNPNYPYDVEVERIEDKDRPYVAGISTIKKGSTYL